MTRTPLLTILRKSVARQTRKAFVASDIPITDDVQGPGALNGSRPIAHAVPAGQPDTVAQITARLFPAYTIHAGHVHLAGCTLEDRLFARLVYHVDGQQVDLLVDEEGQDVDAALSESLHLDQIRPIAKAPQQAGLAVNRFLGTVLPVFEKKRFVGGERFERVSLVMVWCKFAEGKLRFTIGEQSEDLPFAGWARTLQPPPWVCPHTGASTFELAITDDGRIVAAEQIAVCEETGRRVVASELVTCAATGARVLSEQTSVCPVSGVRVLTHELATCCQCGEQVSPTAIQKGRCEACRRWQSVSKADPRLAGMIQRHPLLDRLRRWELSETADRYLLLNTGWLRQVQVVIDKDSLELRRVAIARRLLPRWESVEPERYAQVFGR